jgi:tetratricopeptide (TPR) repeat protein
MKDANEALRLAPTDPQALQLHALLLAGSGKITEAIADLQQLRQAEPDNLELRLEISACPACGSPEQGNEFSGDGQIIRTARQTLWDYFLALVALHQQVGW